MSLKAKKVITRLDKKFSDPEVIANSFTARMQKAKKDSQVYLKAAVEKELKNCKFMKYLISPPIGTIGYDLPAEFGLSAADAQLAYDVIMLRLLGTCVVTIEKELGFRRVKGQPSKAVTIISSFLDPKKYEGKFDNEPFSYSISPSTNKKGLIGRSGGQKNKIQWMNWALNGRSGQAAMLGTIPSVKGFGITYDLTGRQKSISRSGRAIMVKNDKKNVGFVNYKYQFPAGAKPGAGFKNFIDAIASNQIFVGKLQKKLDTIRDYYLIPRKR